MSESPDYGRSPSRSVYCLSGSDDGCPKSPGDDGCRKSPSPPKRARKMDGQGSVASSVGDARGGGSAAAASSAGDACGGGSPVAASSASAAKRRGRSRGNSNKRKGKKEGTNDDGKQGQGPRLRLRSRSTSRHHARGGGSKGRRDPSTDAEAVDTVGNDGHSAANPRYRNNLMILNVNWGGERTSRSLGPLAAVLAKACCDLVPKLVVV